MMIAGMIDLENEVSIQQRSCRGMNSHKEDSKDSILKVCQTVSEVQERQGDEESDGDVVEESREAVVGVPPEAQCRPLANDLDLVHQRRCICPSSSARLDSTKIVPTHIRVVPRH